MPALPLGAPTGPRVSVLLHDGMSAFELGIVTEVFGLQRPELDVDWYHLVICAERPGPLRMVGGASIHADGGLAEFAAADTVIVPGVSDPRGDCSPGVLDALRRAHGRGARVVSICSGAFALAAAGLLDGRRATTHWRYADLLARRFPAVTVDPDVLYVDEGDVVTGAGSAAGLDVCVHIVRTDFGPSVANSVARRLVIPPHRQGGQAQFIEAPVVVDAGDDRITRSMNWALAHLTEPITVAAMAGQAHMSARTYLRHFTRCTGSSPIRWLITQRVHASLPLLEGTAMGVEQVAAAVGFDRAVTFRQHFATIMRTSPSAYRRTFSSARGRPA